MGLYDRWYLCRNSKGYKKFHDFVSSSVYSPQSVVYVANVCDAKRHTFNSHVCNAKRTHISFSVISFTRETGEVGNLHLRCR